MKRKKAKGRDWDARPPRTSREYLKRERERQALFRPSDTPADFARRETKRERPSKPRDEDTRPEHPQVTAERMRPRPEMSPAEFARRDEARRLNEAAIQAREGFEIALRHVRVLMDLTEGNGLAFHVVLDMRDGLLPMIRRANDIVDAFPEPENRCSFCGVVLPDGTAEAHRCDVMRSWERAQH